MGSRRIRTPVIWRRVGFWVIKNMALTDHPTLRSKTIPILFHNSLSVFLTEAAPTAGSRTTSQKTKCRSKKWHWWKMRGKRIVLCQISTRKWARRSHWGRICWQNSQIWLGKIKALTSSPNFRISSKRKTSILWMLWLRNRILLGRRSAKTTSQFLTSILWTTCHRGCPADKPSNQSPSLANPRAEAPVVNRPDSNLDHVLMSVSHKRWLRFQERNNQV